MHFAIIEPYHQSFKRQSRCSGHLFQVRSVFHQGTRTWRASTVLAVFCTPLWNSWRNFCHFWWASVDQHFLTREFFLSYVHYFTVIDVFWMMTWLAKCIDCHHQDHVCSTVHQCPNLVFWWHGGCLYFKLFQFVYLWFSIQLSVDADDETQQPQPWGWGCCVSRKKITCYLFSSTVVHRSLFYFFLHHHLISPLTSQWNICPSNKGSLQGNKCLRVLALCNKWNQVNEIIKWKNELMMYILFGMEKY